MAAERTFPEAFDQWDHERPGNGGFTDHHRPHDLREAGGSDARQDITGGAEPDGIEELLLVRFLGNQHGSHSRADGEDLRNAAQTAADESRLDETDIGVVATNGVDELVDRA